MQSSLLSLPQRAPDYAIFGTEALAPTAETVLATTPALQNLLNGWVLVSARIASDDSVPDFEVAVNNGSEDVSVLLINGSETPGHFTFWMQATNGQYVLIRNKTAGSSAKYYQAALNIWRY